jgi:hypothetical protein
MDMKKITLAVAILAAISFSVVALSNMGEKHHEKRAGEAKEHHEEMKEHHGEMEEHHGEEGILHESMEILEGHADKILDSILHSHFTELEGSARAVSELAGGLEGTKPHKNLENMEKYNSLVIALKKGTLEFEGAVKGKDPREITDNFGKVIGICVECHINFRD